MTTVVTLCDTREGRFGAHMPQEAVYGGPQRAGARRAAGAAREGTLPQITQRNQGGTLSAQDSVDKRRAHAESRVSQARQPWTKFLKTAEWLASELKHQALRDPESARVSAESLYAQAWQFAETLNKQAKESV